MKVIDRLDEYIKVKSLNDNKVTEQCGLSKGYLYKIRKREIDLGNDAKDRILATFSDINRIWFLTGEGDMNKSHSCSNSLNGVAVLSKVKQQNIVEDANRSLQNRIQQLEEENKYMRKQNEQLQEQNIKLVNKMMEKL